MSAHESMEQAEHAEHASGENRKIALLIAVIALFLALSETLGKARRPNRSARMSRLRTCGVLSGQEHPPHRGPGDLRSGQAKPRRHGRRRRKAALQKQIDEWQKTAARYRSEPETGEGSEQLSERASTPSTSATCNREVPSLRTRLGRLPDRHRMASATIITGIITLAWISGLLAAAGIVITALGIFAPHALHLAL